MIDEKYDFNRVTICPDFTGIWACISDPEHEDYGLPVGDGDDWAGCRPLPKGLIDRFAKWQAKFESSPFDADLYVVMDWPAFHAEGMELSLAIKAALGDDVVVIYEKAFEDRHQEEPRRVEVFVDGSWKVD